VLDELQNAVRRSVRAELAGDVEAKRLADEDADDAKGAFELLSRLAPAATQPTAEQAAASSEALDRLAALQQAEFAALDAGDHIAATRYGAAFREAVRAELARLRAERGEQR
jgi:hypothetical protein